jgi:hypothetical protein
VNLNKNLLKESKTVVLGSIVQIRDLSSWSQGEVVHLAYAAHQAREDAFVKDRKALNSAFKRGYGNKIPGVTTTLIIDDVAYISSSMKGGPYFYSLRHDKEPHWRAENLEDEKCTELVKKGLQACQVTSNPVRGQRTGHRTGANCGEVLALQAYCRSGQTGDLEAKLATATVVAIRDVGGKDGKIVGVEIAKPCTGNPVSIPMGTVFAHS